MLIIVVDIYKPPTVYIFLCVYLYCEIPYAKYSPFNFNFHMLSIPTMTVKWYILSAITCIVKDQLHK